MDYSEAFLRQHEEMCQVVGSIVFSLVEAGHDSTSKNIITVLRNELAESNGKWEPDQVLYGVVCGRGRNPTLRLWPAIFSGEIDVFPSERRNMGQEIGR
ncbi:DUF2767 family protein [Enterobacter roggenkampii]|nr:DUF2767 family protein [Enterobacter roggenkampii]EMF0893459.1 DUF2767 family protein [Enterobacter roggenkampii]